MMLDIAMRPAVSTTSVSHQSSQETSDAASFADELARMSATITSPPSRAELNHGVVASADVAANEAAGITLRGGGAESLNMNVEAMSSITKHLPQEPGLRLGSDRERAIGDGRSPMMTPRRTASSQASVADHPARGRPGLLSAEERSSDDGARSMTTMLMHMDEVSRSKSSDFPLLLTQSSPSTPSSPGIPGFHETWQGDASLLSRAGDDRQLRPLTTRGPTVPPARMKLGHSEHQRVRAVEQKAFTERLTELSMMVAALRNEGVSHRLKALPSEGSSVLPEVAQDQPLNLTVPESISSQWRVAPSDFLNSDASFEARDQEHGDSQFTDTPSSDASAFEVTHSMMSPLMPHQAAARSVDLERVHHVPEPLWMTVEHLRSLLPEGGRLLEVQPHLVRLEVVHASGPLQLEIMMRAGVVDVRAHGEGAAEMALRVPELAAALQGSGVRLGSFDVQPGRRGRESSSSDRGHTDHRQDLDDTPEESVRNVSTAGRRVSR